MCHGHVPQDSDLLLSPAPTLAVDLVVDAEGHVAIQALSTPLTDDAHRCVNERLTRARLPAPEAGPCTARATIGISLLDERRRLLPAVPVVY